MTLFSLFLLTPIHLDVAAQNLAVAIESSGNWKLGG